MRGDMFLQERILIDLASLGGSVVDHDLWWNGPSWLSNPEMWPTNPVTEPRPESAAESKLIREVIANVTVSEIKGMNLMIYSSEAA